MTLSSTAQALRNSSRSQLRERFARGRSVQLELLPARCYRGQELSWPRWNSPFTTSFWRSEHGQLHGCSARLSETDGPLADVVEARQSRTYDRFIVTKVPGTEHVEMDHGLHRHDRSWRRLLRSPLRSMDEQSQLILGFHQIDLGLERRLDTARWFLLEMVGDCP